GKGRFPTRRSCLHHLLSKKERDPTLWASHHPPAIAASSTPPSRYCRRLGSSSSVHLRERAAEESKQRRRLGESEVGPFRAGGAGRSKEGNPPAMTSRQPCFLALVLLLGILCASFPKGLARNVKIVRLEGAAHGKAFWEEAAERRRTAELGFSSMDYDEPGANTNPWSGWANPPPDTHH
ncbi:hypothetical protein Taro_048363, partial [Colocasia esculenta]|nr:hypothetical protein [Colocasia esculenta]